MQPLSGTGNSSYFSTIRKTEEKGQWKPLEAGTKINALPIVDRFDFSTIKSQLFE